MSNYPTKVYVNGEIVNHQEAKISVFDRGFLFGDGIYEAMVQINGTFFYGQEHLDRLTEGLRKIDILFDVLSLPKKIETLQIACDLKERDHFIYIQVTRGVAPRKHSYPEKSTPTLMMYAIPMLLPAINENHMSVVMVPDQRWHRCDIKSISILGNIMANEFAMNQNAYEAIFIRDGKITEASHCNIFFVKDEVVYTHAADENILNGITRKVVLQLCKDLKIACREQAIDQKEIHTMDEAFLTGTTTQIASIKKIDNHYFYKDQESGLITKRLQEAFFKLKP